MTWTADHFAFEVADLDRSIHFYGDVLGLRLVSREVDEAHGEAFAFFEMEGGNIELLSLLDKRDGTPFPDIRPSSCPHLAVRTDDLDSVMALLGSRGIPILRGPLEIAQRVRWLYIADPDGNVIEFVQWL
jgi:lactoylglutathione lyase